MKSPENRFIPATVDDLAQEIGVNPKRMIQMAIVLAVETKQPLVKEGDPFYVLLVDEEDKKAVVSGSFPNSEVAFEFAFQQNIESLLHAYPDDTSSSAFYYVYNSSGEIVIRE